MAAQSGVGVGRGSARVSVLRFGPHESERRRDRVATEEPLEIRLAYPEPRGGTERVRPVTVTMRTPGHDVELALGFLHAEGILPGETFVREVAHCPRGGVQAYNVIEVRLTPDALVDEALLERNFYVNSSCGVCGKASLDMVESRGLVPVPTGRLALSPDLVRELPARLRAAQDLFERTGGLHAAGLFDTVGGGLRVVREDVGRHNAVDKVVGHALLSGALPLAEGVLVVSGRASFEILQKAAAAGLPCVVAVGAPSSLAVDFARRFNVTLVGFAHEAGFNVYAGEERIA
jgi:FdhD protein